jgi:selenide,water dikinase
LSHIARASRVTLRIRRAAIPIFDGVREAVRAGSVTDGSRRNWDYLKDLVRWKNGSDEERSILTDPQTSGGLVVAVPRARTSDYLTRVAGAVVIGEVIERGDIAIEVQ